MPTALAHLLDDARFGESLTQHHLPAYLERQRWYTSKGKAISGITLTALPSDAADYGLWLARIGFASGETELRVLAVAEVPGRFAPDDQRVICRTDRGALVDAMGEERFRESLYTLMAGGLSWTDEHGTLRGEAGRVCRAQPTYTRSHVPAQN